MRAWENRQREGDDKEDTKEIIIISATK